MPRISITPPSYLSRLAVITLLGISLVGCASVKLPPPTANAETVQALRFANLAPASVGAFRLADGKDPNMDSKLSGLRGSSLTAASGSFSQQLKDEIVTALKAAALYEEDSPIRIEGRLTDSRVDAATKTGTGRLAAQFIVNRHGRRVYDKELAVEASWPSAFMGAVAIPKAINQYGALYKKLADKLFADKKFHAALKR
ncbi:MAG: hypothetical protein KZQ99_22480 [Candidatus Thiodiazotropha sp. (ex Dulcina madagascariensis)]|nr:hypothetical protein [Candidatus Thiodiazotropha sp. (ex Dulcina madagascariensis)]